MLVHFAEGALAVKSNTTKGIFIIGVIIKNDGVAVGVGVKVGVGVWVTV